MNLPDRLSVGGQRIDLADRAASDELFAPAVDNVRKSKARCVFRRAVCVRALVLICGWYSWVDCTTDLPIRVCFH